MDEVMKLLTADTPIWGFNVHNWMLFSGAVIVLWIMVLAKDA